MAPPSPLLKGRSVVDAMRAHAAGVLFKGLAAGTLLVVLATSAGAIVSARPAWRTAAPHGSLTADGHVEELYPGRRARLSVRVENGSAIPVVLTGMRVLVRDATSGCTAANLHARRFRGHRAIPAYGSVHVHVWIQMPREAVDACIGARFPLAFRLRGQLR
jgi:hypothetical protein